MPHEQRLQMVQHHIGGVAGLQPLTQALRYGGLEGDGPVMARAQARPLKRGEGVGVEAAPARIYACIPPGALQRRLPLMVRNKAPLRLGGHQPAQVVQQFRRHDAAPRHPDAGAAQH
ncbi:hypothetical protein D3C85_1622660 [compost metagenome]